MTDKNKWDFRFLEIAKLVSTWSKDPSTKVGAVAVSNSGQILSTGFNGLPRNMVDSDKRYQNREFKYKYTVHAELNCIYNAMFNNTSIVNSTIYVWGLPVCMECAKGLVQTGVSRIVIPKDIMLNDKMKKKWEDDFYASQILFLEVGLRMDLI